MRFPKLSKKELTERLNVPGGRIRLAIDTDAKNEVDDQFAIAWALKSRERFNVEAIYAAPFFHECFHRFHPDREMVDTGNEMNGSSVSPEDGMEQSFQEIIRVLEIMKEPTEGRVFRGSRHYLTDKDRPVESEAALDLIHRAMQSEEPLYVAAIGTPTNIASALLLEPRLVQKIVVIWLGGHELSYGHGIEFNLIQDVKASQVLFDSGVPLIWVPCNNVAAMLQVSDVELREKLLGRSAVGTYLANTVLDTFNNPQSNIAMMKLLRFSSLRGNADQQEDYLEQFETHAIAWSRIIWDIATIAILKNPNWVPSRLIPSPGLLEDYTWLTENSDRHLIRTARFCHRDMVFGDLFECLADK